MRRAGLHARSSRTGWTSRTSTRSSSTTPRNFGLAQLYQLRGRVGRSARQAYAYLLYNKDTQLTPIAEKRLRAIFEATELGAGFRIAMKDLEIRGAGNLLGAEQSGFVNTVGFDLYTQLLAEAIAEMEGKRPSTARAASPVTLELPVNAYIPDEYINDRALKMNFYQRMANLERPSRPRRWRRAGRPLRRAARASGQPAGGHAAQDGGDGAGLRGHQRARRRGRLQAQRTIAPDRIALYKRFKNDASVQLARCASPAAASPTSPRALLEELRELLPVIVGAHREAAAATGSVR